MKKSGWMLVGLCLLLGALGAASYRYMFDDSRGGKGQFNRQAQSQSSRQAPVAQSRGAGNQSGATTAAAPTALATFDTVISVLNVVVGILGIWMTWIGMRMQRQAIAAQKPRE